MLNKLFAAIGLTTSSTNSTESTKSNGLHHPYAIAHTDTLYNLLFCDDLDLLRESGSEGHDRILASLLAPQVDTAAVTAIAADERHASRARAIAYGRLREHGVSVPAKVLLGTIVEVSLEEGLDVLAAFSDGRVHYLNQSGKVLVIDVVDSPIGQLAKELVAISEPVVQQIGAWDQQRLPPPVEGNVRITFLVSDGLYFGEGPFAVLLEDAMAGPILSKATQLLRSVTEAGARESAANDAAPA